MSRKLRILMVLDMAWDRALGGAKPQIELADELIKSGHTVDKFDRYDAFPSYSGFRSKFKRYNFPEKAREFIKANGHKYDIIDAHQGNLPFTKKELNFNGLIVWRSVGLYVFYEEFDLAEQTRTVTLSLKSKIGKWFRSLKSDEGSFNCIKSLQNADLVNVCNEDELNFISDIHAMWYKCVNIPFGLSAERFEKFRTTAPSPEIRLANKTVVFVGSWIARKGSRDWSSIIRYIRLKIPDSRFLFLGTHVSEEHILNNLDFQQSDWLKVIPFYSNENTPDLIAHATVGAFPSYVEGFGFSVLEKLASGIPTISYNIPGPREMLNQLDEPMMVPPGDIEGFCNKIVAILNLDVKAYTQLSNKCIDVAEKFSWETISNHTLNAYEIALNKLSKHP